MTDKTPATTDPWALTGSQAVENTFDSLLEGADFVKGRALTNKEELIGVPFIITAVRFNPASKTRDFVSIECVTQDNVERVINDGSTGIRRQIVQYLASKERIPAGYADQPDAQLVTEKDPPLMVDGLRLVCPRGLRVSEYINEHGDAKTFYLS